MERKLFATPMYFSKKYISRDHANVALDVELKRVNGADLSWRTRSRYFQAILTFLATV